MVRTLNFHCQGLSFNPFLGDWYCKSCMVQPKIYMYVYLYLNFLNIRFFSAQIIKHSYLFYKASLYIYNCIFSLYISVRTVNVWLVIINKVWPHFKKFLRIGNMADRFHIKFKLHRRKLTCMAWDNSIGQILGAPEPRISESKTHTLKHSRLLKHPLEWLFWLP